MKLLLATFSYLLIGVVLGAGIYQLMLGKPWLLVGGVAVYVITFGRACAKAH